MSKIKATTTPSGKIKIVLSKEEAELFRKFLGATSYKDIGAIMQYRSLDETEIKELSSIAHRMYDVLDDCLDAMYKEEK